MSITPPPPGFPAGPGPQMPWPTAQPPRGPSRWPNVVLLVITLVAVGAAVATWLRPMPENKSATSSTPGFSAPQVADAKAKVCAAFDKVLKASSVNAALSGGDDSNTQLLVVVAQRQVFVAGSAHLTTSLADEPAAPADLAAAAKKLSDLCQVMTLDGMVGDRNDRAHDAANETNVTIQNLCK